MNGLPLPAKLYALPILAAGLTVVGYSLTSGQSSGLLRFAAYLFLVVLASGCKVTLPGNNGRIQLGHVFILVAAVELPLSQAVIVGCGGFLAQAYWHRRSRTTWSRSLFDAAGVALATALACRISATGVSPGLGAMELRLAAAVIIDFLASTLFASGLVGLTQRRSVSQLWREHHFRSLPYYLVGAFIADAAVRSNRYLGWEAPFLSLAVLLVTYHSYRLGVRKLEQQPKPAADQNQQAEAIAALRLRTVEAMALAIGARNTATHRPLSRMQVSAVALGQELGMPDTELTALREAAILHDIGELAVPEYILSKPGQLTPEEFEKMKIHPVVAQEILEQVNFPYPVAPIVRSHHERWDGSGYPDGLAGEQIPIGARILAALDRLDALTSGRQYRRALPLAEAMAILAHEAGKSLDPRVVAALQRRYHDLEQAAPAAPPSGSENPTAEAFKQPDFLLSIAAAREETQGLYEITAALGSSLGLHQTLAALDARLQPMIPYDTFAVYIRRGRQVVPEYVQGQDFQSITSLDIPLGAGLSGWVAQHAQAVLNGDPSTEPGYSNHDSKSIPLLSALAVPLEGAGGPIGVITLYASKPDAFTRDHQRVLTAIAAHAGLVVENSLSHRETATSATADGLTGLPNARSLFLRLDAELARSRRDTAPLSVLVCDLDGFRQVNGRLGQAEGDKVLKRVAAGLVENCREYDFVARLGGDEFVIVLPGAPPEVAESRALVLDKMVRRAGLEICGEPLLRASIGVAHYPQHGTDAEQLLAEADRSMYKVKQQHKVAGAAYPGIMPELQGLSAAIQ